MLSQNSLVTPLIRENPVTFHVLGICAALAITNSLTSSLIMSVAMTTVLVISNAAISLIRKHLPGSVRIIVQIHDHCLSRYRDRPVANGIHACNSQDTERLHQPDRHQLHRARAGRGLRNEARCRHQHTGCAG